MSDRLSSFLATHLTLPAAWPASIAAALLVLIVGMLAYRWTFQVLAGLATRTLTALDDVLLVRMRPPARLLVILAATHVLFALRGIGFESVRGVVTAVELLLVAYLVIETAETFFFHWYLQERRQIRVPAVVRHLVLIILYSAALLSVLGTVTGMNLLPLLATSTVVTVVVGLALQDTLGNLFSGLALHIEAPFLHGDWILVDGLEGKVTHLGWRSTHILTLSGDVVAIPNALIARGRLQNYSAPDRHTSRLVEIPVRLSAAPEAVEAALSAAFTAVPRILADPAPKIWLVATTPLFLRYVVKVWVADFGHHDDAESDLQKAAWHALRAADLHLADPSVAAITSTGEIAAARRS
ncbi:MAG: mechanosensitive ion channel family protein [Pseudomonadota bacterium]|nr:mechanosensitive ion channel family protein [Pseudomonadota bacterium]